MGVLASKDILLQPISAAFVTRKPVIFIAVSGEKRWRGVASALLRLDVDMTLLLLVNPPGVMGVW